MPQTNPAFEPEQQQYFRDNPEVMRKMHKDLTDGFTRAFSDAVIDANSEQLQDHNEELL